ncbi:hypothetical protein [Parasitella parasitica]|uniref:Uncharacterized protein n=1 Tax=Parasitella parasitica TaxID=35722 RepID=A0A0B7NCJ1_9FUNG|nr:hypothetical protein [Parasitella parasitica]
MPEQHPMGLGDSRQVGYNSSSLEAGPETYSEGFNPIDFNVNKDIWASLYAKVVQRLDERNRNITCSDRLAITSALYKQSNDQYRDNLLATSSSHHPKRQKVSNDIDSLVPRAPTAATNVSGQDFRNLVFKAGYKLLKNQFTISTAQELNIMASNLNPTSFGEHLDHLAHHLLGKKQTKEIEFALNLAQYFKGQHLEALIEKTGISKPILEPGLDANMIDFLTKVDGSSKEARTFLMEKRIEVLSGGGEYVGHLVYMAADALPLPDSKASELTRF